MPKTCKLLPKWRNFAKSGHTDCEANEREEISFPCVHVCICVPLCFVCVHFSGLWARLDFGHRFSSRRCCCCCCMRPSGRPAERLDEVCTSRRFFFSLTTASDERKKSPILFNERSIITKYCVRIINEKDVA